MKVTAIAPANIAFIKYWGKADEALRLPLNSSISMNLSACVTTTTVEFSKKFSRDDVIFLEMLTTITRPRYVCQRVTQHLDLLRERSGTKLYAKVVTSNTFPSAAGIASSASGFAALTVAAAEALGLTFSEKELTILARIGSGSACRSIPDGFVEWQKGKSSQTSFAHSLHPADYWDLRDIILVASTESKKTGSTEGMRKARTSPFFRKRLRGIPDRILEVKRAFTKKDIERLGVVMEEDCINMHAVAMTQRPPILYWNGMTMEIIHAVYDWRSHGVPVFFTIDAGPNIHLICEAKDEHIVVAKAKEAFSTLPLIINRVARGAHVV